MQRFGQSLWQSDRERTKSKIWKKKKNEKQKLNGCEMLIEYTLRIIFGVGQKYMAEWYREMKSGVTEMTKL